MRRIRLAVLTMLLLLLSACGSGETNALAEPMAFRAALLQAQSCDFVADMQVDVQGKVYPVTLQCSCLPDGTAEITVLAPQSISGIQASVQKDGGALRFDGLAVTFGLPEEPSLAPIALPLLLADFWRGAYISAAGMEDGQLRVSYEDDLDELELVADTWFDKENHPVYAEFSLQGKVIAEITLTDLVLDGG